MLSQNELKNVDDDEKPVVLPGSTTNLSNEKGGESAKGGSGEVTLSEVSAQESSLTALHPDYNAPTPLMQGVIR